MLTLLDLYSIRDINSMLLMIYSQVCDWFNSINRICANIS